MTTAKPEKNVVIAALYHFTTIDDTASLQTKLQTFCDEHNISGTLLLANEGINGTIAGTRKDIDAFLTLLNSDQRFANLEHKEALHTKMPFHRMKVRLKKEIVTIGLPNIDPNKKVGTYVNAEEWNKLVADPNVVVIDTRNDYEYKLGTFKNAMNPKTDSFREFPEFVDNNLDSNKHKKAALFCTGGIRCEKATAYMLEQGFEEVYHLKGGILKYFEDMNQQDSLWKGECFVFDSRVTVDHNLKAGNYELCPACRTPLSAEDKQSQHYIENICCPHCRDKLSPTKLAAVTERQKQIDLAKARNEKHLGQNITDLKLKKQAKIQERIQQQLS